MYPPKLSSKIHLFTIFFLNNVSAKLDPINPNPPVIKAFLILNFSVEKIFYFI